MSEEVRQWALAAEKTVPVVAWELPERAKTSSLNALFVNAVLSRGTNMTMPAFTDKCAFSWSGAAEQNLSDALWLSACVPKKYLVRTEEQAKALSAKPVSDLVVESGIDTCADVLGDRGSEGIISPQDQATYMAILVEALPATGSCTGGCPLGRPLCNGNGTDRCVTPTCQDVKALCYNNTDAGALARFMCSVTCGCDRLASALLWIGPEHGCLPACQKRAEFEANYSSCSDAQPGSPKLAALVEYSSAFALNVANKSLTSASVRAKLGCFALQFERDTELQNLCDQNYWITTRGAKSLLPFCPASCGCILNPSKRGCPGTCTLRQPPRLHDLSDAQLRYVASTFPRTSDTAAYPQSCLGLNATVCDALRTVWHKHPCPVACNLSSGAAIPASAHTLARRPPPARRRRPPPPHPALMARTTCTLHAALAAARYHGSRLCAQWATTSAPTAVTSAQLMPSRSARGRRVSARPLSSGRIGLPRITPLSTLLAAAAVAVTSLLNLSF